MKNRFNFNTLSFKTVSLLIVVSLAFITIGFSSAKKAFSSSFEDVINEKIEIVLNSIAPQISLNLSYGLIDSIDEICNDQLENKNILQIEIESQKLQQVLKYERDDIDKLYSNKFVKYHNLVEPSSSNVIGSIKLVYSSEYYDKQMRTFYINAAIGSILFITAILLISVFLHRSLKPLSKLKDSLNNFNPYNPEKLDIDTNSKDEIDSIVRSANIMVENLISYIDHSSSLTKELSQQQQHLKDAQRIASVGSWQYDIQHDKLTLSDEIFRIIGMKKNHNITFEEFVNMVSSKDRKKFKDIIERSIEKGSTFNIKYKIQPNNKKAVYVRTKGKVRKKSSGEIKLTAVTLDITSDTHNKQVIEKLAYYDSLTNLPNRVLFRDRAIIAIKNAKRYNTKIAIMFLDLDNFKNVNDTLGHSIGDQLLIHVSKLLSGILRDNDTVSRVGGDEFTILLTNINTQEDVEKIALKIFDALEGEHNISGYELLISTSIGIALFPDTGDNIDTLIRNADTAMYEAKKNNKNNYKVFDRNMYNKVNKFVRVEQDLRKDLQNEDAFEIYYQAKIAAKDGSISGCEALVRWRHKTKGLIYPDDFIGVAEESGLIIPIGNIVIKKAIKDLVEFNKLKGDSSFIIAINLSPRQFTDNSLIENIQSYIDEYKIPPKQLEFEITESLSMQDISKTLEVLHDLKKIGVSIAIDDFGTGYSSLSYLKQFPINTLKIDKSFVLDMTFDNDDKSIVNTIINMAKTLNFKTVAEGVETQEHAELLADMECDNLQGYYYSVPVPKDQFIDFLKNYN